MNDQEFFAGFSFREMSLYGTNHRDNSHGVPMHYLGYMKKGRGLLVLEKGRVELNEGDMFYIPKGCRYHSYWIGEEQVILDSLGFAYLPNPAGQAYKPQRLAYSPKIWEAYRPLSEEKTVDAGSIGRLYMVLGLLLPAMQTQTVSRGNRVVTRALQLMEQDPFRSIPGVAEGCGVSQATLYGHFKQVLNKTPNTVRQEVLCQKAIAMLSNTDLSVEEISRRAGFSSASYFRKVLFAVTGKTPRQIRRDAEKI